MGKASLERPQRLAEKLLSIRTKQNLSQNGLIDWLGLKGELTQAEISAFERGVRIPSLPLILRYARKSQINVEILIDDEMNLPEIIKRSK